MMQQATGFVMRWPDCTPNRKLASQPLPRVAGDLYAYLLDIRRKLANAAEVPAYVVAPNRTLREMAANRPANREGMMAIHGMGMTRFDRFGPQFLEAIQAYGAG